MPQALKPLSLIHIGKGKISQLPLLALWGNKNWLPSMKVKELEILQNKSGLKGCKWSSLNAKSTETPMSYSIYFTLLALFFNFHHRPSAPPSAVRRSIFCSSSALAPISTLHLRNVALRFPKPFISKPNLTSVRQGHILFGISYASRIRWIKGFVKLATKLAKLVVWSVIRVNRVMNWWLLILTLF